MNSALLSCSYGTVVIVEETWFSPLNFAIIDPSVLYGVSSVRVLILFCFFLFRVCVSLFSEYFVCVIAPFPFLYEENHVTNPNQTKPNQSKPNQAGNTVGGRKWTSCGNVPSEEHRRQEMTKKCVLKLFKLVCMCMYGHTYRKGMYGSNRVGLPVLHVVS